jgi:predicted TIM-barrel fold metal-dependent hydrolase
MTRWPEEETVRGGEPPTEPVASPSTDFNDRFREQAELTLTRPDLVPGPHFERRDRKMTEDPEPRPRIYDVISVDDHLMEPRTVFEGRLPKRFADDTPRVVELDEGREAWLFEGVPTPLMGLDALVTWEAGDQFAGLVRYDEIRRGTWDPSARVADMDAAGIWASLNFPSMLFGFAGQRFMRMKDRDLGLACMRAYNTWLIEEWVGAHPDRFIPSQVTWLPDVEIAAEEIRHNAARGFKAVSFTENPEKLLLPSIHTGYWDPFLAACEETGTVINLHIGSSSSTIAPSSDSPMTVLGKMFTINAMMATLDWIFSDSPRRFPDIKIAMSEGGIGWVPWLYDRIDYHHGARGTGLPPAGEIGPQEILYRNFWFTSFWDPRGFAAIQQMNEDRIMVEVDYPHSDTTWPDTMELLHRQLAGLADETVRKVTAGNAASLYRHPLPPPQWSQRPGVPAEASGT